MSPPAATKMRPAGTGSSVHEPIRHIFRSFVGQHRKMGCCPPALYRSFTSTHTHTHTHTPHRSRADEMKMKVRWQWKWNEIYLTRTRRGERKRRGTERTPTQHTWPGTGKPWKGKKKTDNGTRPAGGEGRKRLNQPNTAKTYAYLGTRRTKPTWRGENTWNRGPMGN